MNNPLSKELKSRYFKQALQCHGIEAEIAEPRELWKLNNESLSERIMYTYDMLIWAYRAGEDDGFLAGRRLEGMIK